MDQVLLICAIDTRVLPSLPSETENDAGLEGKITYRSVLGDRTELGTDFRYHQLQKLQNSLKAETCFIDVARYEVEELELSFIATHLKSYLEHCNGKEIKIYFSSFVSDLKIDYRLVNLIFQYCHCYSIEFCVVEDIIYVPRPYIFDNAHNNFFRNVSSLDVKYSNISKLSIQSSNQIMNCWGEDDTCLVKIPELEADPFQVWEEIHQQIHFTEMLNQGNAVPRLISIQSIPLYDSKVPNEVVGFPIYRHPNDEEPINTEFSPVTKTLLELVERYTGVHGINHVLIQYYRDGRDNIAAHSDKTLDIDRNTPIINLSVGHPRDMFLQNKQNKSILQKIPLQHGECVIFGLKTNQYWYHEVPKNVTIQEHPIFGKGRVSFTFRKINTFFSPLYNAFIGQGSPFKSLEDCSKYKEMLENHENGKEDEEMKTEFKRIQSVLQRDRHDLIPAFSKENKQSAEFSWEAVYGEGFVCK
jgi:hypothetical protein